MVSTAYVRMQAENALDAQLCAVGARWKAQRHAAATAHPVARKAVYRRINAAMALRVAELLAVYLEDLDVEGAR